MSTKPFSEVVEESPLKEETITPFVSKATGGREVEIDGVEEGRIKAETNFVMNTIGFLSSLRGVVAVLLLFFVTVLTLDAVATVQQLLSSGSLLEMVYLVVLLLLLSTLLLVVYKNYREILSLKSAAQHQRMFYKEREMPSRQIVPMTLALLSQLPKDDRDFVSRGEILRERISSSHDYSAIYKELDEEVLEPIDQEAQRRIKVASTQAALSTAISPLALLDAAIVIWRGVRLTKEIATLYGFKPGWLSTIVLLKQGAFTVLFVGAAELAGEYVNAATESTVVSKISLSAGEGISNGILLARIGYGVMAACRPLPMRVKRGSFIRGMVSSIKETMTDKGEKQHGKTV